MDATSINFVIAAYALTWIVLGLYAFRVHRALREARDAYARTAGRSASAGVAQ